jgi:hypothetical protein
VRWTQWGMVKTDLNRPGPRVVRQEVGSIVQWMVPMVCGELMVTAWDQESAVFPLQ